LLFEPLSFLQDANPINRIINTLSDSLIFINIGLLIRKNEE